MYSQHNISINVIGWSVHTGGSVPDVNQLRDDLSSTYDAQTVILLRL